MIPADLPPVWQQLIDVALVNSPHLAPLMSDTALVSIDTQKRTAFVATRTEEAATVIMAEANRYVIQRGLRTLFKRPLLVRASCLR